ncbi:MAG: hypothetical protein KGL10_09520 [Alphaproteobacteria bacterium]|nr:hypothetical protein [Alphaproteobacteria bacterium]MDE2337538.1 hypothetical protein [Alphaproteobacteria bacterium]
MKTFRGYLFAAVVAAGGAAWPALAAHAGDSGGYGGLIAPAGDTDSGTTATPDNTEAATPANPGYAGLIPGMVPAGGQTSAPAATQQQQTAVAPSPFDQALPQAAPEHIDIARVLANAPPVQRVTANFSTLKPNQIGGMPDMEFATQQAIRQSISTINDAHLSNAQRLQNARKAYKYLSSLAAGLRVKQDIPDRIYKNMGLSDSYIAAQKAGNVASLDALNTALESLKPYQ